MLGNILIIERLGAYLHNIPPSRPLYHWEKGSVVCSIERTTQLTHDAYHNGGGHRSHSPVCKSATYWPCRPSHQEQHSPHRLALQAAAVAQPPGFPAPPHSSAPEPGH